MGIVRDVMTDEVEVCSPLDTVNEVATKMKELNVGAMPIVDNGKLVGIITDRDIVIRCIAENTPTTSKVSEIMSKNLITINPEDSTEDAVRLMARHQIRRLPVVQGDKLIGIVALGDLAVNHLTDDQAKEALTEISEPSHPNQLQ